MRMIDAHVCWIEPGVLALAEITRRPSNLTLDPALVAEARELGVNISRAAEDGLRTAVRAARAEVWRQENKAAIHSSNAWVERVGLPLAAKRLF
jgi:antitoxin CcdA